MDPEAQEAGRQATALEDRFVALAAASLFGQAVRAGRRLAVIGTWLPGLAAGVTACLAFASFVRAGTAATDIDPLTVAGLLAFVAGHWMQLVLLCAGGLVVAWRTARPAAGTACPGDDRTGAGTARSEALGKLGEALVASEIEALGWQCLRNVVLDLGGWMTELELSLISERVTAGMRAAETRGKHLGRPPTPQHIVSEIVALATSTDLSIRQIQAKIAGRASRSIVGEITKRARATEPASL